VSPGGGAGWDEPPLDIQIPDDARELERDVLAYRRELRAKRRRRRLKRLARPFTGHGTIMPLLASILAVCLVAGAMLSVATIGPAISPSERTPGPTSTATPSHRPTPRSSASVRPSATAAGTPSASAALATPSASHTRPHPSARASATAGPASP